MDVVCLIFFCQIFFSVFLICEFHDHDDSLQLIITNCFSWFQPRCRREPESVHLRGVAARGAGCSSCARCSSCDLSWVCTKSNSSKHQPSGYDSGDGVPGREVCERGQIGVGGQRWENVGNESLIFV
jgi:hypothetical protein